MKKWGKQNPRQQQYKCSPEMGMSLASQVPTATAYEAGQRVPEARPGREAGVR